MHLSRSAEKSWVEKDIGAQHFHVPHTQVFELGAFIFSSVPERMRKYICSTTEHEAFLKVYKVTHS